MNRLPYPIALTLTRLKQALADDVSPLASLFAVKDCFEAAVKFLGSVLVAEYLQSTVRTPERDAVLIEKLVRPALGHWVNEICRTTSEWLGEGTAALLFSTPGKGTPTQTQLFRRCSEFVNYRNDALGHGSARSDARYREDLQRKCLPALAGLLNGLQTLADRPLLFVTAEDRAQVWMGAEPTAATVPGAFRRDDIGRFVLAPWGGDGGGLALFPFLCYLPGPTKDNRLHFYDSVFRYSANRKEATVLEYDGGERHPRPEPLVGFEDAFTADLLAQAFKVYRGRMAVIEGRVANFGELIETHAAIVGRKFVIERVQRFLRDDDRGLLVIEGEPGRGKTALMAHLIEEVFGGGAPRPVHFFYRRTAGIIDPDVCVRSLYHALLDAHGLTEAGESQAQQSPEEVSVKLVNLLAEKIAPRLSPGRPQLIFLDALDEANGNAFRRIPENLPAGVYVIATTRPVAQRTSLARREHLHWFNLDAPDLLADNLNDGREYVRRELLGHDVPRATEDELARIGAGNFLVLKLLCRHVRARLSPSEVPAFLERLATVRGEDTLGFIYSEFWERLTERCPRELLQVVSDVAGVLVLANAPLTRDVITAVLGLNTPAWDAALRALCEYLTVIGEQDAGGEAVFYRVYHESFADHIRAQLVPGDVTRLHGRLGDFCFAWADRAEGFERTYSLRFGVSHLLAAGAAPAAAKLLLDWQFLEAKAEAGGVRKMVTKMGTTGDDLPILEAKADEGLVKGLVADLTRTRDALPVGHECATLLTALERSISHQRYWLSKYPRTLFHTLFHTPEPSAAETLRPFLTAWRSEKTKVSPETPWLTAFREEQGTHLSGANWLEFSPDGRHFAVGNAGDGTVEIADVSTGELADYLHDLGGAVTALAWSRDGTRLAVGVDRVVQLFAGSLPGVPFQRTGSAVECEGRVTALGFAPDGGRLAVGLENGRLSIVTPSHTGPPVHVALVPGAIRCIAFSPDGSRLAAGTDEAVVHIWDTVHGYDWDSDIHMGHREFWIDDTVDGNRILTMVHIEDYNWAECAVVQLAFSQSGERLVSFGRDGKVITWPGDGGHPLAARVLFTDAAAVADPEHHPWLPASGFFSGSKLVLESTRSGLIEAWIPCVVDKIRVQPGGRLIGGVRNGYAFLLQIESGE